MLCGFFFNHLKIRIIVQAFPSYISAIMGWNRGAQNLVRQIVSKWDIPLLCREYSINTWIGSEYTVNFSQLLVSS